MENELILINVIINGLMAIGTLLAVIVALFQERIKAILIRPKLQLMNTNIDFTVFGPDDPEHSFENILSPIYIFNFLEIKNSGLSTAIDTKCTVRRYSRMTEEKKDNEHQFIFPVQLPWIDGKFNLYETKIKSEVNILPEESMVLAFLCVRLKKESREPAYFLMDKGFSKKYDIDPNSFSMLPLDNQLIIEINLFCKNFKVSKFLLNFSYDPKERKTIIKIV